MTGIDNWNVLCRWAFCHSLSRNNDPKINISSGETAIEMTWQTFTGGVALYSLLLLQRYEISSSDELHTYFNAHISRGIDIMIQSDSLFSSD